jgi:hypothetical protein
MHAHLHRWMKQGGHDCVLLLLLLLLLLLHCRPKACLDVPVSPSVQRKFSSGQQLQASRAALVQPRARTSIA